MVNLNCLQKVITRSFEDKLNKIFQGLEILIGGGQPQYAFDILEAPVQPSFPVERTEEESAPWIVWADDCKKLDAGGGKKKSGPVCKSPDMRPKVIPPYLYGFCKEKENELPMSCPPKTKKRGKGPCCHDDNAKQTKGGCRTNS